MDGVGVQQRRPGRGLHSCPVRRGWHDAAERRGHMHGDGRRAYLHGDRGAERPLGVHDHSGPGCVARRRECPRSSDRCGDGVAHAVVLERGILTGRANRHPLGLLHGRARDVPFGRSLVRIAALRLDRARPGAVDGINRGSVTIPAGTGEDRISSTRSGISERARAPRSRSTPWPRR